MSEAAPETKPLGSLERSRKIQQKRAALFKDYPREKVIEFWNEITKRADYLRNKYKNHRDYAVFQALVGGTFSETDPSIIEEDFPGEDSVEEFMETLEKKYSKEIQE